MFFFCFIELLLLPRPLRPKKKHIKKHCDSLVDVWAPCNKITANQKRQTTKEGGIMIKE